MFAPRLIIPGIALLLSAEPHTSEARTVRDLLKSCESSLDSVDYSYCLGVMDGAEDIALAAVVNELRESQQYTFPLPNDPQTGRPFTDPRMAIIAIDKDLARLSPNPYAHEKIMALRDWRDRIGESIKPRGPPSGSPAIDICFSHPEPTPGDLADAFVAWAKANPSAGDWDEALGLVAAFRAKWPCGPIGH
jgi:hypothetical protein